MNTDATHLFGSSELAERMRVVRWHTVTQIRVPVNRPSRPAVRKQDIVAVKQIALNRMCESTHMKIC